MKIFIPGFFCLCIFFSGCKNKERQDTTLAGEIKLAADESFFPLISSEIKIFEYQYKEAKVNAMVFSEKEAIAAFLSGKADQAVVSRDLNSAEKEKFKKENIFAQSYIIASDALAFIVNPARKDSVISIDQLSSIFEGKIKSWSQLDGGGEEDVILAFDQSNSSNLIYIFEHFKFKTDSIKVFATGSNAKVIEYVKSHKEAIGIIGLGWISEEPENNEHLKDIKVLSVAGVDKIPYSPSQQDLSNNKYPFKRNIYLLNRYKTGLGTGFASFILSEDGQRIILKTGLLPVKMPGRDIIVN